MTVIAASLVYCLFIMAAIAPIEAFGDLRLSFNVRAALYCTWFMVWTIVLPALIMYKLGWT